MKSLDAVGNIDAGSFIQNGGFVRTFSSLIVDQLELIGGELRYAKLVNTSVLKASPKPLKCDSAIQILDTTSEGGGNSSVGYYCNNQDCRSADTRRLVQFILLDRNITLSKSSLKTTDTPQSDQEVYVRTRTTRNAKKSIETTSGLSRKSVAKT